MAKINRGERNRIVLSPTGPVARDLARRAERVVSRAKVLCPVDTGRLRASIVSTRPAPKGTGLSVKIGAGRVVGTNVEYALAVHEGAAGPGAPRSWRIAASRGGGPPARRFLTNALPAMRG
jgi:hypothetical protein